MNKLLKLVCLTLLMAGSFGCASSTEEPIPTDTPATDSQKLLALRLLNGDDRPPVELPPPVEETPTIWGAEVDDTFTITRTYDATTPGAETLNFDFTGFGIDDNILDNIDSIVAEYSDGTTVLLSAEVLVDNGTASWEISDETPDLINKADVTTDIYNQTFLQSDNIDLAFANAQLTTVATITVTDDEFVYVLDGLGGDTITATVDSKTAL